MEISSLINLLNSNNHLALKVSKYFEIHFYDIQQKPVALVVYKLRVY